MKLCLGFGIWDDIFGFWDYDDNENVMLRVISNQDGSTATEKKQR